MTDAEFKKIASPAYFLMLKEGYDEMKKPDPRELDKEEE